MGGFGNSEDDAALIAAVNNMAKALVKTSSFDYRDVAHDALLYTLQRDFQSAEYREAIAVSKCRGVFLDRVNLHWNRRVSLVDEEALIKIERRRTVDTPPFGLWPQELIVYAKEVHEDWLRNPPKRGRGRPVEY